MTDLRQSELANSDLPMPARHLKLYGRFWDIVSLTAFGLAALSVFAARADALTWREIVASVLCIAQGLLYFFVIRSSPWPFPHSRMAIYFVGGIALWAAAAFLTPHIWWLGFTYFGQMFGILPPVATLPGTAILAFLIVVIISGWDLSAIPIGMIFGFSMQWMFANALYLYIYSISRTSGERAKLIAQLEAAQKELELARRRDAELAALRERERLARDLHDSLGHSLATLSVQLEAVQRLYKVDADKASAQVDELKNLTRASTDDLRRSLAGLRAPGLGERKLHETLQSLSVDVAQRARLAVACQIDDAADQLSSAHAETIWRVAQEALANIERHAAARNVDINLAVESQFATFVIKDDGRGLPSDAEGRPGHFGLRGMRERVEGLGGTLTLSSDGGGSRVDVKLPIL